MTCAAMCAANCSSLDQCLFEMGDFALFFFQASYLDNLQMRKGILQRRS